VKSRALQWSAVGLAGVAFVLAVAAQGIGQAPQAKSRKVVKTDAEWRKLLTPQQYMVTRHAATEPAFDNKYWNNHAKGTYECVCCGTELFTSKTKFDSGTGWPSFYAPVDRKNVDTSTDYDLGYARTEVLCNACGAHLGHVFDDAPQTPTGLRFCMNSASLKFVRETPAAKTTAKDKAGKKSEKAEKTGKSDQPAEKPEGGEKKDEPKKDAPAKDKETPAPASPK
jgi:peptide-methionine (R)-S-oxide reductase